MQPTPKKANNKKAITVSVKKVDKVSAYKAKRSAKEKADKEELKRYNEEMDKGTISA